MHAAPESTHQLVRPSLQALYAACAPPTLADSLDELEQALEAFGGDLDKLAERLTPLMHPVEDEVLAPATVPPDLEVAPAIGRVQDARRQIGVLHEQLFEIASRIAL